TISACEWCIPQSAEEYFKQADWVSHVRVLKAEKSPCPLQEDAVRFTYTVQHVHQFNLSREGN
ncbi:hypothetical protein PRIPAC_79208, partial [Pristionchus pacificus]